MWWVGNSKMRTGLIPWEMKKKVLLLFDYACHPCTGTMLIFSVYLSVCLMSQPESWTIKEQKLRYIKYTKKINFYVGICRRLDWVEFISKDYFNVGTDIILCTYWVSTLSDKIHVVTQRMRAPLDFWDLPIFRLALPGQWHHDGRIDGDGFPFRHHKIVGRVINLASKTPGRHS